MEAQDDQECKQEFSSFSAAALRAEAEQLVAARHLRFHLEDRQSMPGDEVLIGADRQLLREVLDELLENAITYSPEGVPLRWYFARPQRPLALND